MENYKKITAEELLSIRQGKNGSPYLSDEALADHLAQKDPIGFGATWSRVKRDQPQFQSEDGSDIPFATATINNYVLGKYDAYIPKKTSGFKLSDIHSDLKDYNPFNPFSEQNRMEQKPISELPKETADLLARSLPYAGGFVGGAVGAIGTSPTVAGIPAGALGGAGIGAGIGEIGKQALQRLIGTAPEQTIEEELKGIGTQTVVGTASELGGRALFGGAKKVASLVGEGLKESAKKSVGQVLAPTTMTNKALTQKITPEILSRPTSETIALTRKGMLEKASGNVEEAGEAILDFPNLAGKTQAIDILKVLEAKKSEFIVNGKEVVPEAVSKINDVQRMIGQFGHLIKDSDLQSVGRILSKEVAKGKNAFLLPVDEASKVEAQKIASNAIRSILAEKYPDLAKLNKEFTFWKGLQDILESTVSRKTGQSSGLIKNLATMAGASAPGSPIEKAGYATAFRWIASVIDTPAWGLVSGKIKNKIADSLLSGSQSEIADSLQQLIKSVLQNSFNQESSQQELKSQ